MRKTILAAFLFILIQSLNSQEKLKPGFDAEECKKMLEISAHSVDTPWVKMSVAYPQHYNLVYRSDTVGLKNRWDLWLRDDSVGVISIRGTVAETISWLEDFYSAMIPAAGKIKIGKGKDLIYKLADDTAAYVHAGFLLGLAYLAPEIVNKINGNYIKGVKEYFITGHSQGGAIANLLTSYLHYLPEGTIPGDIKFKTYSSAPPKCGNLFYSYDFDYITRGGMAFRIVSTLDWVPMMPFTVQTIYDFNKNNPVATVDTVLMEQNIFTRIAAGLIEKSILESLNDARDILIKYLGEIIFKVIKESIPGIKEPQYAATMDYTSCGVPVILIPRNDYFKFYNYRKGMSGIFMHHFPGAYYYLLKEEFPKQ
ncbi:MAG: lipase family protein [Ignavibacteriae bacterium]|nr:MAG: lipase family protein [Ignavibacteriota bacterium]